MALLHMRDFLTITKGDARFPTKVADSKSLFVKAHATHCGTINGNYRFYRPDSMQKATHTWLPFGAPKRPVIINHKEDSEVLGRVVDAKYVDESYKWSGDYPTIKDSLFYKTDGRKTGLFESVDWIVDNLIDQKGYTGLGYIELGLNITNPDAIEKVLRDEYLTVSVGFTTDSAICSICHQDWAADDRCEHVPGEIVDKKQMFLICSPKAYDEVSFVTFPADPFASVFSKEQLKDSLQKFSYLGLPISRKKNEFELSDSLFTYDITHAEETMNNFETLIADKKFDELVSVIKGDSLTSESAAELKTSLHDWAPETEEEKTKKRSLQSTLTAQVRKRNFDSIGSQVTENPEILTAITNADAAHTPVAVKMEDIEEVDRDYFNDASGIFAEIEIALADAGDPAFTQEQKDALTDADFFGPNKTFPVINTATANAAVTVIEKSKLSDSTKSKLITAIVTAKASFNAEVVSNTAVTSEVSDKIKKFAGEKFTDGGKNILATFDMLDKAYDAAQDELKSDMRQMLGAMQEDWYADNYVAHMKTVLENRDMAVLSSQDLTDKDETVNSLSDRVTALTQTISGQKTINNALLDTYKRSLATQIVVFKTLKGQEGYTNLDVVARKSKVDELAKRHVEYLKDTVNDILSEVKFDDTTSDNTATEPGVQISDSARVEETQTTTTSAMTDTKHVVDIPLFLTPSERKRAVLQAAYEATKKN